MGLDRVSRGSDGRRRLAVASAIVATAAGLQLGFASHAAAGAPITISGSMEGNLPVHPNDTLRAGYDFTIPGAHPAATVTVSSATVSLTVQCADKSTVPLSITFPTYTVSVPAGNSNWFPSGDQSSALVYQSSTSVPSSICGGAGGHAPQGATFSAQFSSTDTKDPINVRFHYADNTAGSWSGTAHVVPSPPAPQTVQLWVQNLDSCKIAVGGGTFVLNGNSASAQTAGGTEFKSFPAPKFPNANMPCPRQGGDCTITSVGCVTFTLAIPTSGTASYTVTQTSAAVGDPSQAPDGYTKCEGGSACQSETINVTVDSAGNVQGNDTNVYPDGTVVTFPISDVNTGASFYSGTQSDPVMFFSEKLGNVACDSGPVDADDHNGSTPGGHCEQQGDTP